MRQHSVADCVSLHSSPLKTLYLDQVHEEYHRDTRVRFALIQIKRITYAALRRSLL